MEYRIFKGGTIMAFEKLKNWKERRMIGKTKKLWNEGYNSLEIAAKLRQPVGRVQEWIKMIVADSYIK